MNPEKFENFSKRNFKIDKIEDILPILQKYIDKKVEDGVEERLDELNEPDGSIIWECIGRALKMAQVPNHKWEGIRKHVESSMHDEGWKFKLA